MRMHVCLPNTCNELEIFMMFNQTIGEFLETMYRLLDLYHFDLSCTKNPNHDSMTYSLSWLKKYQFKNSLLIEIPRRYWTFHLFYLSWNVLINILINIQSYMHTFFSLIKTSDLQLVSVLNSK